jgi:hypothetical protein
MSDKSDADGDAARAEVKVEEYARVLAHIMHFGLEQASEVLLRLGFDPKRWQVIDEAWTAELALGIKLQQRDRALRFSTALAKARKRLAANPPALASIGPLPSELSKASADPDVKTPINPPASPSPIRPIPSYSPGGDHVSPWAASGGVRPRAPAAAPPAAAPLAAAPVPIPLGTADISAFVPKVVLPFNKSEPSAIESIPVEPPPPRDDLGGTVQADAISPFASPTLPFEDNDDAPPAPRPPPPAPPPPNPLAGKRLIRFDPQTGQPLVVPYWVDE